MIKKDNRTELKLNISHLNNKKDIRGYLLQKWSKEAVGTSFRYFVETLSNNRRIYLERPANLNKGCDFVIYAENLILFKNGNDKPPKHDDLLEYINNKKETLNDDEYQDFFASIKYVYKCQNVDNIKTIDFEHELILKLSKWFFIEQDITYWAKSGRSMLFEAIKNI